jgi:hypothetical protein
VSSKVKQRKKKRVGTQSLTHSISRIKVHVGASSSDQDKFTIENSKWNQPAQPKIEDN